MLNWVDAKEMFYRLSRMGVTSVTMTPDSLHDLETLASENTDDGGSHVRPSRMKQIGTLTSFYGIRIEEE
jgi:hypothetical protein